MQTYRLPIDPQSNLLVLENSWQMPRRRQVPLPTLDRWRRSGCCRAYGYTKHHSRRWGCWCERSRSHHWRWQKQKRHTRGRRETRRVQCSRGYSDPQCPCPSHRRGAYRPRRCWSRFTARSTRRPGVAGLSLKTRQGGGIALEISAPSGATCEAWRRHDRPVREEPGRRRPLRAQRWT